MHPKIGRRGAGCPSSTHDPLRTEIVGILRGALAFSTQLDIPQCGSTCLGSAVWGKVVQHVSHLSQIWIDFSAHVVLVVILLAFAQLSLLGLKE